MELQDWRVVAASSIGTSHIKFGTDCQDAYEQQFFQEHEAVLLVASDGAGSASQSETGAKLATAEILDCVRNHFEDGHGVADLTRDVVLNWLAGVAARIAHRAVADGLEIREYACTLVAAIVSPTHACFFQVGDGAIVIRPRGDDWAYVFWPQHGEYINTTVFVTDPSAVLNAEFSCNAGAVDEVAVFTDGIEALVLHQATQSVHSPFFDKIFAPVRALDGPGYNEELSSKLGAYLSSPVICERTDDDKTLLLASRLAKLPDATVLAEDS
ncbi:protein phosphatase 2C domain-containing protein [Xanthomonas sacchari]|uniref:PP2C family serine/threonine-protein phosphatase n=1 Tax=Xanthomonas sacchari TaxID=56458 RepID=UPI00224F5CFF|nr:PP2C family serine/threonine-protein phosphatase [Xanthomonas sacchari]UYK83750.1 protein phosphatase 2C domain-containing protein [Xanthomonas sacchari]